MRKSLLAPIMLVVVFVMGCGLTPEQRAFLVDETSARVTAALKDKMKDAADPLIDKAVAAVLKKAAELKLTEDTIKQLGEVMQKIMDEVVTELLDEKMPGVVEKVIDKVIPKAAETGGGGSTGKGILATVVGLAQILLGLKTQGGVA